MAIKTATISHDGAGLRLGAITGSGHRLVMDDAAGDAGMRPAELLPTALAGCTAMDVISILRKKRQDVTAYAVEANGTQADGHPAAFTRIDLVHIVEGPDLDREAVRRSIELSATQYCSVGATLSSGMTEIHHAYRLIGPGGASADTEVVVLGPSGAVRILEPVAAR
jgi:putative redox protein